MSDYSCYIVDDEADSLEILQDYVAQTPSLSLTYSTNNPRDIFSVIPKDGKPKITFLDIEMPGITGLELAGLINSHTAVIFVTSHSEHALEAFEKDAYDFLVKPVSYPRFLKAVAKVQSRIQSEVNSAPQEETYFYIRGNRQGELIKIHFNEILYLESLQNYVKLHTEKGTHITYLTLKEFEFKLNRNNFLKVHKSYVVNLDSIARHIDNKLYMKNEFAVPIGASYRQELLIRLKNRIFSTDRRKTGD
ncbi:LytR/AlgR family response regulator transcription factor [Daejeonella lutea]|uniref:Two component transcriptional regulator, LytTR family n=1 Tax=Daejeonella lutea TaxID=572036 RepID=A0A1T5AZ25_9SPHI|nr:response regulator transcription factor [Daejeonella lutea]SKB40232.1 two component transcriptional regulator, LytTR family [Daejeonella lutea]